MRCDDCEPLLLDHLYGLLDPADAAAVEQHLAGCGACTAARGRAGRTQSLFARAAKLPFPQVRFTAPADEPATVPSSLVPAAKPRRAGVVWWAVAAGVLAVLTPAALLPLDRLTGKYGQATAAAKAADDRATQARLDLAALADQPARAEADRRLAAALGRAQIALSEWTAADEKAAQAGPVAVSVTRPAAAQPGAPNEFVVAVRDAAGALAGQRLEAEVRDGAGKPVFSQAVPPGAGGVVRVPAGVWAALPPGAEPTLAVAAVDPKTGTKTDLLEPVRLFGPVYATLLTTDKAQYRPGERLLFRSLTLDRVTLRPPDREQVLRYTLTRPADPAAKPETATVAELVGTTGVVRMIDGEAEPVAGPDGRPVRGVGCGAFALPADLPDGDYTLSVAELPARGGVPPAMTHPATRTVKVRAGGPERFAKRVTFGKASFAAGEMVEGTVEVRQGDRPVAGAELRAVATADGRPVPIVRILLANPGPGAQASNRTDADGRARFQFVLPKPLARGDVRLLVTVKADGAEEVAGERVPVVGPEVVVEFFPEGGPLVAGVANRVYVRATTPAGTPVDVRGVVSGPAGEAARVASPADVAEPGVNRGLAAFTFTPRAGAAYTLALDGKAEKYPLPAAVADGVALSIPDGVTAPGQPIRVTLTAAGKGRVVLVGAYLRGRLVGTQRAALTPGTPVTLSLAADAGARGGVARVTVWEEPTAGAELVPVAERLVFRKPGEALDLAVDASKPGELTITGKDETGKPAAAILWAAVVNAANAPGPADRSPVTHFLLAGEVRTPDELEHADFLLSDHPQAGAALDLVLATQGWRRFAEQKPAAGRDRETADLLARLGGKPVGPAPVAARFRDRYAVAAAEVEAVQKVRAELIGRGATPQGKALAAADAAARRAAYEARGAADAAGRPLRLLSGVGGGLFVLGAVCGVVLLVRAVLPLAVLAFGAAGLGVVLFALTPPVPAGDPAGPEPEFSPPDPGATVAPKRPAVTIEPAVLEMAVSKGELRFTFDADNRAVLTKGDTRVGPLAAGGDRPLTIPEDLLKPRVGLMRAEVRPPVRPDPADVTADAGDRQKAAGHAIAAAGAAIGEVPAGPAADRIREVLTPAAAPLVAREYAAPRPGTDPAAPPADTLLWKPLIVLPGEGRTTLRVPPGGGAGGYQVFVGGHTPDGRLGAVRAVLPAAPAPRD